MSDLLTLTIAQARDALKKGQFKATELADAYISAVEAARPLNAYIVETPDKAREMAAASDGRIARGEAGALEGIPLGIKDLFATKGIHTQACSHILDKFKPAYESTVTANLWADGAVMLGKLNMDEFAMGSSNETSYYGPVKNPWRAKGSNVDLVPGGSSGGSAAAVAAHICAGGHGNRHRWLDTPAGRLYRDCRHQANLWQGIALGNRGVCILAGPGWPHSARRARCRHSAQVDGQR